MTILIPQSLSHSSAKSIEYAQSLMRRESVTPEDRGCQEWLAGRLSLMGFDVHQFEVQGVKNLVASIGEGPLTLAFAGHTDVVPPGDISRWKSDPFGAEIIGNELVGRGAADMKTGLAAMLAATERHLNAGKGINNRFMWLITSDEEGEAEYGSKEISAWLDENNIKLDMCLVGEPTAHQRTGDNIKIGRRGALSARLVVRGKQGHVAYPQYADNAVHKMQQVMASLLGIEWDEGSDDFPGTGLQITYVNSGDFTDNIVPSQCELCFNIRYSHKFSETQLKALISQCVNDVTQDYELLWERPCEPYFTHNQEDSSLISSIERAIHSNTGKFPLLSTSGGTSDGRFFASSHTQVVECGVPNKTIHQVNERIHIADLVTLEDIFTDVLNDILC